MPSSSNEGICMLMFAKLHQAVAGINCFPDGVADREPIKLVRMTRLATKEISSESSIHVVDEKPSTNAKSASRGKPAKKAGELEVDEFLVQTLPKGRSRSKALDVTEGNDNDPLDSVCQLEDSLANIGHFTRSAKSTQTAVKQENDDGTPEGRAK
ncbi:hypothetical protein SERLA73DRAFT_156361 [Serpula lacrymans var. lacrymans S7.3]|uniref:Uncharacterized protein n=1 Tax=Serpula lacrymans var. lacrymans (strain S7.3) TaxID=936435 RepID=F8QE56_SERL3|nr:hypothetical protein SERLA73DRAFT_156361 [Serpula lacrymans var. lacrymans S7.3]